MKKLLLALSIMLAITACSTGQPSLDKAIIGTWTNPEGYQVQFSSGGTGFIPGVPGKIPDSNFSYTVVDASHISIDLQGQKFAIEIHVTGDTLTWKDSIGEVVYKRAK